MARDHPASATTRRTFLRLVSAGGLAAVSGLKSSDWGSGGGPAFAYRASVSGRGFALPSDVKGRTPWAIVLCRFNDLPPPAIALSDFNDFFAGPGKGGVFDYWRDVSYGAIDLTGSKIFGWYTMKYSFFREGAQGRSAWINEAIRLVKESGIDLSAYYGVVAVVNANVDDSASGRNLALGIRSDWGQSNWRWCKNCMVLAYAGNPPAACPSGGVHDLSSSWNYALAIEMPSFPGQNNWRWCRKCQALAYAGSGAGVCSAGGTHDQSRSADYRVAFGKVGFPGQNNWKWCKKCQVLAYAGKAPGACSAGGQHDHSSSGDYTLVAPAFDYESHFDAAFAAHEMGHCYGLSHAHCAGKSEEYCDPWDIMGAGYSYKDPAVRYAPLGPGLDAPHLCELGWMPESRIWTWTPRRVTVGDTIQLAALNRPDIKGYLMARLVMPDRTITVEFRRRTKWDRGLPGDAVVVHEIRSGGESFLLGDYSAGQRWADLGKGVTVLVNKIDSTASIATISI